MHVYACIHVCVYVCVCMYVCMLKLNLIIVLISFIYSLILPSKTLSSVYLIKFNVLCKFQPCSPLQGIGLL